MVGYRIPHIEDLVFDFGKDGRWDIVDCLNDMQCILEGRSTTIMELSVKWDGSPSIVCGMNHGRFFVGTKSIFNKVFPLINYTNEDIDRNHESSGLRKVLKLALKYFPELQFEGIIQGDIIYSNTSDLKTMIETINDVDYLVFKPNTISYAIPIYSPLIEKIQNCQLGVIWHSAYNNLSGEVIELPVIESTENVWCRDASITTPGNLLNENETNLIEDLIEHTMKFYEECSSYVFGMYKTNKTIREYTKTYINECVRLGKFPNVESLYEYVSHKLNNKIQDAVRIETKENRSNEASWILKFFNENSKSIQGLFDAWSCIYEIKKCFIEKMETIDNNGISTFLETTDGSLKKTSHEGYILTNQLTNDTYKIVNRFEFSKANFANMKD